MKILVPCDFSKNSNNAALYAAKFAKKVNAKIILFNVIHYKHPLNLQVQLKEDEIKQIRFSDAIRDCSILTEKLKSIVKGVQISFEIVEGFPLQSLIEDYAMKKKIDLIVMGTHGASGLQKTLFGSNAVNVINRNSTPVITVPQYARFNNLKHIVFASDTSDISKIQPRLQKLIPLAQFFGASIDILHVLPFNPEDSEKKIDPVKIKIDLINKYKYKKISFHVTHNDDVLEAINNFSADKKADLLVMFTHDITFFENIFNTSFSREIAFHSLVPLLTIKK